MLIENDDLICLATRLFMLYSENFLYSTKTKFVNAKHSSLQQIDLESATQVGRYLSYLGMQLCTYLGIFVPMYVPLHLSYLCRYFCTYVGTVLSVQVPLYLCRYLRIYVSTFASFVSIQVPLHFCRYLCTYVGNFVPMQLPLPSTVSRSVRLFSQLIHQEEFVAKLAIDTLVLKYFCVNPMPIWCICDQIELLPGAGDEQP